MRQFHSFRGHVRRWLQVNLEHGHFSCLYKIDDRKKQGFKAGTEVGCDGRKRPQVRWPNVRPHYRQVYHRCNLVRRQRLNERGYHAQRMSEGPKNKWVLRRYFLRGSSGQGASLLERALEVQVKNCKITKDFEWIGVCALDVHLPEIRRCRWAMPPELGFSGRLNWFWEWDGRGTESSQEKLENRWRDGANFAEL